MQTPAVASTLVSLPRIRDERGCLSFVEAEQQVPFPVQRIYYITEVPSGARRGGHAHINNEQFIIAVAGSFEVTLDTGTNRQTFTLDQSDIGLYVPKLTWRELQKFTDTAVCLVLSSQHYEPSDYIEDYDEFLSTLRPVL